MLVCVAGANGERGVIYSPNGQRGGEDDRDLWFKAAVIAVPIAGGFILVLLVLLAVRMLRTDSQRHRRLIQVRRERSLTKAQLYVTDHFTSDVKADPGPSGGGTSKTSCGLNFTTMPPPPLQPPSHPPPPYLSPSKPPDQGQAGGEAGGSSTCGNGGQSAGGGGVKVTSTGTSRAASGGCSGGLPGFGVKVGVGVNISGGGGKPVCRDVSISLDREGRVFEQCDVYRTAHHLVPSLVKWGHPGQADSATVV